MDDAVRHCHAVTSRCPLHRDDVVAAFSKWFKRWFEEEFVGAMSVAVPNKDHFRLFAAERWSAITEMAEAVSILLRSDESLSDKWEYLRQNPVRAGLVANPEDWPFQFASTGDKL